MLKTIENKLESFVRAELAGVHRVEITHGTMYLVLDKPGDCDFIHREIRKFYKENINPEGGVNMYAVGDEFAFDFVPADRETPVFTDEEEKGIWSEFAEEGLEEMQREEAEAEIAMELEAESKRGK